MLPLMSRRSNSRSPGSDFHGTVVSSKMNKTVVVTVQRQVAHPVYGKQLARTKKYYAHDEENAAREGDIVRIMETRPLSRLKRWRVVEIVEKAK